MILNKYNVILNKIIYGKTAWCCDTQMRVELKEELSPLSHENITDVREYSQEFEYEFCTDHRKITVHPLQ